MDKELTVRCIPGIQCSTAFMVVCILYSTVEVYPTCCTHVTIKACHKVRTVQHITTVHAVVLVGCFYVRSAVYPSHSGVNLSLYV